MIAFVDPRYKIGGSRVLLNIDIDVGNTGAIKLGFKSLARSAPSGAVYRQWCFARQVGFLWKYIQDIKSLVTQVFMNNLPYVI